MRGPSYNLFPRGPIMTFITTLQSLLIISLLPSPFDVAMKIVGLRTNKLYDYVQRSHIIYWFFVPQFSW